MDERRKYVRLPVEMSVLLNLTDGSSYNGRTQSISFGGAFIEILDEHKIQVGKKCALDIRVQNDAGETEISIIAQTVHTNRYGIGFKFLTINEKDYDIFKDVMVKHSPEPDELLQELEKNPGLILNY